MIPLSQCLRRLFIGYTQYNMTDLLGDNDDVELKAMYIIGGMRSSNDQLLI